MWKVAFLHYSEEKSVFLIMLLPKKVKPTQSYSFPPYPSAFTYTYHCWLSRQQEEQDWLCCLSHQEPRTPDYTLVWCLANQRRRISQRNSGGGGFYPHIPLCVHEKEEGSNWEGGWGIGWDSSMGGESRIIPPPSREHLCHHFVEPQDGFLGFFLPMPRKFSRLSLPSTKKPNFEGAREKRKITKCALSNQCAGIDQMCH